MLLPDGRVLENPTNAEIALASGGPVAPDREDYDLVIVGAGPAGLSAAVYGASEGFNTLVVDDGGIGGQATSSSLIRNYLGFPRGVSGRRLAQRAYEQAWVLGASFAFMQEVADLRARTTGSALTLSDFGAVHARAVVLQPVGPAIADLHPALEELNGAGVFYGGPTSEAPRDGRPNVYILGARTQPGRRPCGPSARYAAHVTVIVRADSLAAGMSHYQFEKSKGTERRRPAGARGCRRWRRCLAGSPRACGAGEWQRRNRGRGRTLSHDRSAPAYRMAAVRCGSR